MIDPHVYCRDGKQAYKETIAHVFETADEQSMEKIFDMPNTDPPILSEKGVKERLKLVPENQEFKYLIPFFPERKGNTKENLGKENYN